MSWVYPGSNPLSTLGDSIEGDIGGESPVRLRITGLGGLMTSNGDVLRVDVDPQTGELAAVGTDVGFAGPFRRFLQLGIYNGDFSAIPSNTSSPITDENFLPYWQFVPAASSNITATWIADSGTGSGGLLRFTATSALNGDLAYIKAKLPVAASAGQTLAYAVESYWSGGDDGVDFGIYAYARYLRQDATTYTGTAETSTTALGPTTGTFNIILDDINSGVVPADAGWLEVRFGMVATQVVTADVVTIDLYETSLTEHGTSYVPDLEATARPGMISKTSGVLTIASDTTGANAAMQIRDDDAFNWQQNSSTAMTLDSSGRLGIGDSTPAAQLEVESKAAARSAAIIRGHASQSADLLVVENSAGTDLVAVNSAGDLRRYVNAAATGGNEGVRIENYSPDSYGGNLYFAKSRNATAGSHTIVQSGDTLGVVRWGGSNGTSFDSVAAVAALVDGTPGASSDMPSRLAFYTSPDGSAGLNERYRITSGGAWNGGGTSFPTSGLGTNDRFFRTDRGIEYYYDGTRWLSVTLYTEAASIQRALTPYAASTVMDWGAPFSGVYDLWLVQAEATFHVAGGGSALSGSHKWVLAFIDSPGSTTHATRSIDSGSSGVWRTTGAAAIGALLGTSDPVISVTVTKTGTPGDLYVAPRITYRLVG